MIDGAPLPEVPPFARSFFSGSGVAARIGNGALGGKAAGLVRARQVLADLPDLAPLTVDVPRLVVLTTDVHERFLRHNGLLELAAADDITDTVKAHAFQQADLPVDVLGDLMALADEVRSPLAVRSSSLLEDALHHPLAGVYATKMTPNAASEPATRFAQLVEAIKFLYASAAFASPRRYLRAIDADPTTERMAVILQEVVGREVGRRFYPQLSGVARSWNFYPGSNARPEDGAVSLALGLGKTIVDGGVSWTYSPARPTAPPPFASNADRARGTQTKFWAIRMGLGLHDPLREDEHLVEVDLHEADLDDSLQLVASTWDTRNDRRVPGVNGPGTRILDFAPLLEFQELPLNRAVRALLDSCSRHWGEDVEIEFAARLPYASDPTARLGLLQVRPMAAAGSEIELDEGAFTRPELLLGSRQSMGHGVDDDLRDVVYIPPDRFSINGTRQLAAEVEQMDTRLAAAGRRYVLIGFGRWGSSDQWLGIPVRWDQIAHARVIVEAMLPQMNVEPSQGAHFFHNVASLGVKYLTVPDSADPGVDWAWLNALPAAFETEHLRHVELTQALQVKVDGRTGRGVVMRTNNTGGEGTAGQ